jgi:hypothetical protein
MEHAFGEVLSVDAGHVELVLVAPLIVGDCVETQPLRPSAKAGVATRHRRERRLAKKTAFLSEFTGSVHRLATSLRNAG